MSRSALMESSNLAAMPWVARLSLCLVVVLTFARPSCLVTSVPEFPVPQRFGPLLRVLSPDPQHLIRIDQEGVNAPYEKIEAVFEVYSEDVGKSLWAAFLLDDGSDLTQGQEIDPDSLHCGSADAVRQAARRQSLSYTLPAGTKPGCHVLRLVVGRDPYRPSQTDRPAVATWWLDVDDPQDKELLSGCPGADKRGTVGPDAGATGGGSL